MCISCTGEGSLSDRIPQETYLFLIKLFELLKIVLHTGEKWIIIVINLNSIISDVLYLARVDED